MKIERLVKSVLSTDQSPEDFHIRFAIAEDVKNHGIASEIWETVK